jgi:hypothetical protein
LRAVTRRYKAFFTVSARLASRFPTLRRVREGWGTQLIALFLKRFRFKEMRRIPEATLGDGQEEVVEAGAMGMSGHGGLNLQGQRQRIAALTGGDARSIPCPH